MLAANDSWLSEVASREDEMSRFARLSAICLGSITAGCSVHGVTPSPLAPQQPSTVTAALANSGYKVIYTFRRDGAGKSPNELTA